MTEQLQLSEQDLIAIGFTKKVYHADEMNPEKTTYEIPCLNGCFYYNLNEPIYRWYQEIKIGDFYNDINLDIDTKMLLFSVLSAFKVDFHLVINNVQEAMA